MKRYRVWALAAGLFLTLSGCMDDSDDDVAERDLRSDTSSAGGGGCGYSDLISASEREAANACGIQVSSQFLAADAYLEAAIESCQMGYVTEATSYYSSYESQVQQARSVAQGFDCTPGSTGGGGGFEDTSDQTYYILCSATLEGTVYAGCFGPVQYSDSNCPTDAGISYNYVSRHESRNACISGRDSFFDSF